MKIAVSSQGNGPDATMDDRFGRAPFLLIFDSGPGTWEYIDNSESCAAAHGAGIQTAQRVVDRKVEAVVTGHCGPKALSVLEKAGIEVYVGYSGPAVDAAKTVAAGTAEKKKREPAAVVADRAGVQEKGMKTIAIPVVGGILSPHFGHCETFEFFTIAEDGKGVAKRNTVPAPDHQPGLLPGWLAERGAEVIIAGGMGDRAAQLFAQAGVEVITGAPNDAPDKIVEDYLSGALETGQNACDH